MSTTFHTPGSMRACFPTSPSRLVRCSLIAVAIALAGPPAVAGSAAAADSKRARCSNANITLTSGVSRRVAVTAVRCLINKQRAGHGRRHVRRSSRLRRAATRHTADMIRHRFVSHASSRGDSLRTRARRAGYVRRHAARWRVGEAIVWGAGRSATPARLVEKLMASRSHRRVILGRRYRELGVGIRSGAPRSARTGNAVTMTLDFGRRLARRR